ncbi:MAG TPA: translocation/assembly module TamB domain-containing protein, partial [Thermoanaerobaculia bacterium]|nr:translocation/assembly module TamB domain-containing protein [Thermoanaerobaculia bacterium]
MIFDRKDEEAGRADDAGSEAHAGREGEPARRRGCRRLVLFGLAAAFILLILALLGGYFYLGTASFAELVRLRIESTLENRLGREVTIGRVSVTRTLPSTIILQDIRIANAPGGVHPFFAHVREVEIRGGVQSFLQRRVELGQIDVRDPQFFLELYPEDHELDHNFPSWKRTPPRPYQIYRMDVKKIFVTGGLFDYNDIRRDMHAQVRGIDSEVTAQYSDQIYFGIATSPSVAVRIKDYEPFDLDLRADYRYEPGALRLESVALRGRGIEAFLSGDLEPVTEAVYDFKLDTRMELARIREIFGLEAALSGSLAIDGTLKGKQGTFELAGSYSIPELVADTYELAELRGELTIDQEKARVRIASAEYGGGTISGVYDLAEYAEPYPMSIELDYDRVSLEKLFEDWGVEETGLRGAATGGLTYAWNQDKLLEGSGRGNAKLVPGAIAFGQAPYPIPLSGATNFALDAGTITFARSTLRTPESVIDFSGKLQIEGVVTDLAVTIDSKDFSELDRIAYNFARTADKDDYELLGFGGAGTITGTVRGPIDAPQVAARIAADGTVYNDVLLGRSDIDLAYDGARGVLTFNRGQFAHEGGTLSMTGTIGFPDAGPGPRFDLRIEADNWDVPRALQIVELELEAQGLGTGALFVRGTPEQGTVTFESMRIVRSERAYLNLNGDVTWLPGEGNVAFNLDIGANSYPVSDLIAFLDLGELPITGDLTGTLHIEGPKDSLEGAGAIMVRGGTIYGEPVEQVTVDLVFTEGFLRASNIELRAEAGIVTGEAEYNFATETFGYTIQGERLDLSRIEALAGVANLFGGRLTLRSSGGGTLEQPELVVEAVLEDESLDGADLPEGAAPPTFYLAIRNGQMIVRGSAYDVASVEGTGTISPSGELDGLVQLTVTDIERFLTIFAPDSGIPAAGSLVADFRLAGSTSSLETIVVEGTVPTFDVSVGGQKFTPNEPMVFALRDGSFVIDSFSLQRNGSVFDIAGSVGLTGDRIVRLSIDGSVDAALLQLFVPDAQAEGLVNVAANVTGTLSSPRVNGTAELMNAQLRLAGFPQLIGDITGALVFRDQRIEIDSLRATVGGGTIVAGGFVDLEGAQVSRFRVNLQGTEVALRYFEGVSLAGDFSLLLSGDVNEALLQGEVVVDRAVYTRDFEAAETILNLLLERSRGLVPAVAASWQDKVALRIDLIARDTLAIRNNIADVTGDADLDVTGTLANPVILGLVEIHEGGTIEFQDVEYTVVRGTINFQNPFRIDPFFDITAEGRVQEYDLTVNLSGTMDRIVPSISSDPPVSGLTLLSLLGPSTIGQGPTQGVTAGSLQGAGTSLLFQSVGGLIGSRIFPFADSFRVDAGMLEGSSSPEPTVTFEKQIDSDLRVIVTYNTVDSKKNRQVIEWQVRPEWILQFTRDREEEYILEARFRRRYDGRWGRGSDDVALTSGPGGGGPSELTVQATDFAPPPPPLVPPQPAVSDSLEPGPPEGREFVTSISFRTDSAFDLSGLPDLIPLEAGRRITIRDVRNSISRLYATGDFRDIIVEGETTGNTIAVTFVLSMNYRLGAIAIEGAGNLSARAESELNVREGDVLSLAAIDRSAAAIARMLEGRGYLEALVEPETEYFRETNRADVIFHVELGPAATIAAISIEGDPDPFTIVELEGVMGLVRGDVFRQSRAASAAQTLENHLIRRDYRQAAVRFVRHEYDEATESVQLFYTLNLGPKVSVDVEGVPRRAVRRQIPFGRTEPYSEDRIDRASREIIEGYQRRGHYEVVVDIREERVDDTLVITFEVDPGREYELRQVLFEGNEQVPDRDLTSLIATSRPGGFRKLLASLLRRGTGVTREMLGDDRDTIEAYYRLDGFSL